MVEPGDGAHPHGAVVEQADAVELIAQAVDRDEVGRGALALAQLDEHVGAAGDDLGALVFGERPAGVGHARGLVEGFDIVH